MGMKKIIIIPLLLASLITPISWRGDFDKGLAAALRGDYATALNEWMPLAKQGDVRAQFNLGLMYYNGTGITQNYKRAVKWYIRSAEQGFAEAQNNLGVMYENGTGTPQNYKTAMKWYTLAAEQGHARAQNNLSVVYLQGEGVTENYIKAHMWANIARYNGSENTKELIETLVERMTQEQIAKAQDLAQECVEKAYKGC